MKNYDITHRRLKDEKPKPRLRSDLSDLLACPFCGSKQAEIMKEICEYCDDGENGYFVHCTNCHAESGWADEKINAIYLWNRRAS